MASKQTIAWWKYNPILQKPTSLDPVRPWSWFWYYGPDPAAGVSYGQYHDEDHGFDIVTEADTVVYSPATGKPMEFISEIDAKELKAMFQKTTSEHKMHSAKCTACLADLRSDFDLSKLDTFHCSKCGAKATVTSCDTERNTKTMKTATSQKTKKIQNIKRRIKANVLRKKKEEAIREKRKEIAASRRKMKASTSKSKVQKKEEYISFDRIIRAMEEQQKKEIKAMDEYMEEEDAMMEEEYMEEEAEASEMGEMEEEESMMEEAPEEEESMMEMEEEESMMEEAPEEEESMMEEEEMAAPEMEDESSDDDELIDLDMVLSMVNKKQKLAEARKKAAAKVAQKKKKKKKVKASEEENMEVIEEKEDEMDGSEESMENAEVDGGDPAATPETEEEVMNISEHDNGEVKPEPDMVSEENPAVDEENEMEMEAMKFEPLASLDQLRDLAKEDVDMTLYYEGSDNPIWNVTVAGVPTARIQLQNQPAAEEIRAVFCNDDYAKELITLCQKRGFVETMKKVNAEFWANHTSNSKIAKRFEEKAESKFAGERKELIASYRNNYRDCLNIATAGLSKNFYPEVGNALKDAFFSNLRTIGVPEDTAVSAIEKSFVEGAAQYYSNLFDKAEEYMNMTEQTRREISAAISNSAALNHGDLADAEPATLSERVAYASVAPAANGQGTPLKVNKELNIDASDYKNQLKAVWKG